MSPTVAYWIGVAALCICFPLLLGFVLGVGIICGIRWFWMRVLEG